MALTLHLVRHGETSWNAEGRIQGQIDAPLNERGRAQARATAAALQDRPIGAVLASDLSRAFETALAIAAPHQLGVQPEPALRERDFGVVEGRLYRDVEAEYGPARWEALLYGNEDHFSSGESTREHYDRVAGFMDRLLVAPPAPEVVLVSHGGTVRRLRSYLRGGFEWEDWAPVANGEVLTVTIDAAAAAEGRPGALAQRPYQRLRPEPTPASTVPTKKPIAHTTRAAMRTNHNT